MLLLKVNLWSVLAVECWSLANFLVKFVKKTNSFKGVCLMYKVVEHILSSVALRRLDWLIDFDTFVLFSFVITLLLCFLTTLYFCVSVKYTTFRLIQGVYDYFHRLGLGLSPKI